MKWVHFPLHPDTPSEGRSLKEMYAERGWSLEEKNAQMKALMDAEGLPYGFRTHTYNSRFAQELGAWADTQEGGEPIHDALYRAYFVDNRNLADIDVLMDVVEKAGLSVASARQAIEERTFKLAVDEDWEKSHAYGVTGVPTFVAGGYGLVGAQPYENLAQFIESVREKTGSGAGAL
jgi:predicted DsbA family dithiol-disulfide isomerase